MKQKAYTTVASLVKAGNQISAGAAIHAATLGLVVATKPLVDADVTGVTDAVALHLEAIRQLRELRNTRVQKERDAYNVAHSVRDVLKRSFGRKYNPQWEGTGFTRTLQVPKGIAGLEQALRALQGFLTANPSYELAGVATVARVETALQSLETASAAVTVQKGTVRSSLAARKEKEKVLRNRISGVVNELARVLGPIDGRWDAFGLNQPGILQVPPTPEKVSVASAKGTVLSVKWNKSPRAAYYRVWVKVLNRDEEAVPVGTPADLDFTMENIPAGAEVEVAISAVNNGGESARSEVTKVTMS